MSKYDKWYIIGKLLCSTLRISKIICKFAKIEFFIAKSSYMVKMFAKKIVQKWKIILFWKVLEPFQMCKKKLLIFNNLMCDYEKLKMCQFLLTGCMQIICKYFFAKLVQFVSLCQRLSNKLGKSKSDNWKWVKRKIQFITGKSSHSANVPEDSRS